MYILCNTRNIFLSPVALRCNNKLDDFLLSFYNVVAQIVMFSVFISTYICTSETRKILYLE